MLLGQCHPHCIVSGGSCGGDGGLDDGGLGDDGGDGRLDDGGDGGGGDGDILPFASPLYIPGSVRDEQSPEENGNLLAKIRDNLFKVIMVRILVIIRAIFLVIFFYFSTLINQGLQHLHLHQLSLDDCLIIEIFKILKYISSESSL